MLIPHAMSLCGRQFPLYIVAENQIKDNEGTKKEANVEGDDAEKDKHKEHEREKEKGVDVFILE